MSEYSSGSVSKQDSQKVDIMPFLRDLGNAFKRRWWLVLILAAAGAVIMYFGRSVTYTPAYTASATVSVKAYSSGASYDNSSATAEQLGKVFPYILTSGALVDIVAEDMGTSGIPGNISVTNVEGTNLLTIKVTSADGQTAYDVLQSFIENYPRVAQYVVGQTDLTIIEDSGVPENTGTASVLRGSAVRGALIGIIIGLLILVIDMMVHRTVRNSNDFKSLVNAPYLGTLPLYKKKKRASGAHSGINILDEDIQVDYIESIRIIRTRLERHMEEHGVKTIMVTSSIPGEGKSTVATNLAIAMAKKGKKVVLVDCDLRNPSTKDVLNLQGDYPGLVSVLKGTSKLSEAMVKVDEHIDLYCLYGASKRTQKVDIMGRPVMGKFIEVLEDFADVVILDTPPSAVLVDASILVKYVKSAVYVVMSDYARRQYVQKGISELDDMGITIEGCIMNGGAESSYAKSKKR